VQLVTQGRLDVSVFPSSVSRARFPSTTNSLFDTGRILVTGAPSVDKALYACMLFVDKINRSLKTNLQVLNFTVQNIVASFSLGYSLDVALFARQEKTTDVGQAHYEPSLFRGCSWRHFSGLVFVVFASGKVVLTGSKCWLTSLDTYRNALATFAKYRIPPHT
jgi:transcription initiation factor TFIID TATA-box-binding protein